MEEQIKAVHDYFKAKILSGDFEVKRISDKYFQFKIDHEYNFIIWVGNPDIVHSFEISNNIMTLRNSFMDISFTIDEKQILKSLVMPFVNDFKKSSLLEQKRKELQDLEDSLK